MDITTIDATTVNTIVGIIGIIITTIGIIGAKKKKSKKHNKDIKINQQSTGDNNMLIGIQVTKNGDETDV